jgi:hypothetical protein
MADFKETEKDRWRLFKRNLILISYIDIFNKYQRVYFWNNSPISKNEYYRIQNLIRKRKSVKPSDVTLDMIKKICGKN